MNNEEKEWLRDRVNRWADSDLRHYEGSESVCHDVQQDRYALIALIDRQPTEEGAIGTMRPIVDHKQGENNE